METGKSSSGWVGAAALGMGLVMACLAGNPDPGRSGIIRDACGPTDGPAIAIRIEEGTSAGCPASPASDTVPALHRLAFHGFSVDSLEPGVTYRDSGVLCAYPCPTMTYWSLTPESIDRETVRGDLWMATGPPGDSRRERRVRVVLRRCSQVHPMCG